MVIWTAFKELETEKHHQTQTHWEGHISNIAGQPKHFELGLSLSCRIEQLP
jgi:hypothetical protein